MSKQPNKEAPEVKKKYYPKDHNFEGLFRTGVKDPKGNNPQIVKTPATTKKIRVQNTFVVFNKGVAVSPSAVARLTKDQVKFYLDLR